MYVVVGACKIVSVHVEFPVYMHEMHVTFFPKSNTGPLSSRMRSLQWHAILSVAVKAVQQMYLLYHIDKPPV